MQALILAAGLGTRLKPITNKIPKCLVEIKGKKLLEIWLDKLHELGVKKYLINTHHCSDQVIEFINNSKFRSNIDICYEENLLGTAGTLSANLESIDESLIFLHADNYTKDNLKKFVKAHETRPNSCLMTMLNFRTNSPESCGILEVDQNGIMTNFVEKPKTNYGNLANGAIYYLSLDFLTEFKNKFINTKDFSVDVLPHFKNKVYTYETNEFFIDIGNPKNLSVANMQ